MRLDHIAYRVPQGKRDEVAKFFIEAFGYRHQDEFPLEFDDGTFAKCIALEPPEKVYSDTPWTFGKTKLLSGAIIDDYHLAPEIFISEGTPGSIVDNWVQSRGGFGGIHHLAYQVDDVEEKMKEWQERGWASFSSERPITCPGLTQVFSKPNSCGVVFEFIKREGRGFCKDNVRELMQSTRGD